MAKSFLDHLARVADKEIKRSRKEAERNRKKLERERIKQEKSFNRESLKALKAEQREKEKDRIRFEKEQQKLEKETKIYFDSKLKLQEKINTYIDKASELQQKGNISSANNTLKKALYLNPKNKVIHNKIIKLHQDNKDYEEAESTIVEALNYFPNDNDLKTELIKVSKILIQ